jgi:tellurite resistance protein TerC
LLTLDLTATWLEAPVWMWLTFAAIVLALLIFDLGVLHRGDQEIGVTESLKLSAFYIAAGLAFGVWVWHTRGADSGTAYFTGFLVEKTLAMDNVFVIAMIFSWLAIPRKYQHRVLFWGILGVVVLRGLMIGIGATLVSNFAWVLLIFAAFLIFTGIKLLVHSDAEFDPSQNPVIGLIKRILPVTERLHGNAFFVRLQTGSEDQTKLYVTPLFLALISIEIADVIFAVDSVPAIFAITTDPFIVYTSNIFAILGLRALYFALAATIHRFAYLKTALALVLIFVGAKVVAADLLGLEKIPAIISLGVTAAILIGGVIYSVWRTARDTDTGPATPNDKADKIMPANSGGIHKTVKQET